MWSARANGQAPDGHSRGGATVPALRSDAGRGGRGPAGQPQPAAAHAHAGALRVTGSAIPHRGRGAGHDGARAHQPAKPDGEKK
eukprot:2010683-Pyramimonas_sp.AAC.1